MAFVIDTPEGIEAYRLLVIHKRLKMEMRGMRFGISTFAAARRELGMGPRAPRQRVLDAWEAMLREKGILQ